MNFAYLPSGLRIVLADVGSAGGLHKRWKPVKDHLHALLFDPFEQHEQSPSRQYFSAALWDRAGVGTLNVTRRETMTSMLVPNAGRLRHFQDKSKHAEILRSVEVATDTFDSIIERANLAVDVIKIDVQGGEQHVLDGAGKCLSSSIFLAEVEVSFFDRYQGLTPFEGVVAHMRERGFDLLELERQKRYRYINSAGITTEGSGGSGLSPLGKLAFCDAIFLLREDRLLERLGRSDGDEATRFLLKAITVLLIYGKSDVACWLFDAGRDLLDARTADLLSKEFRRLRSQYWRSNLKKRIRRRLYGVSDRVPPRGVASPAW